MGALYQAVLPPDIETLADTYLSMKMAVALGTKLPKPPKDRTVPGPYLRVEFGGGKQVNLLEFDVDTILHSYAPDEVLASLNCRTAFAHMASATGETVSGWYVGWCRGPVLPHRSVDPRVNLPRYRAMVTWRVAGQPLTP